MSNGSPELLLISCPPWDTSRPPINLAYLASFMRSRGYAVDALDLSIKFYNELSGTPLREMWEVENINKITSSETAKIFFANAPDLIELYLTKILESGAR